MRLARATSVLVFALLVAGGCATTDQMPDIAPGERPALESDEAGLWMRVDRAEEKIKTSGRVVTDPALNAYVREVFCNLAGRYCGDIRLYVVRAANFNASMAPNGAMFVWTGLMLRAQNEAQFAYVLGHELAHYLERHSLERWRTIRATTNALLVFKLAVALAGVPVVGTAAELAALGGIMSYSRDHEREADRRGFEAMVEAGYDPHEAAKIWDNLLAERDASDDPKKLIFFSTHPAAEERSETLRTLADEIDGRGTELGRDRFLRETLRFRALWLRDELRERDFKRMAVLLDQLADAGDRQGEIHFFRGELHRLRGEDDDPDKAVQAYKEAIRTGDAPPEAHRALGLVHHSQDRAVEARAAFESYLRAVPDAEDRAMIEFYLEELQSNE